MYSRHVILQEKFVMKLMNNEFKNCVCTIMIGISYWKYYWVEFSIFVVILKMTHWRSFKCKTSEEIAFINKCIDKSSKQQINLINKFYRPYLQILFLHIKLMTHFPILNINHQKFIDLLTWDSMTAGLVYKITDILLGQDCRSLLSLLIQKFLVNF